VAAITVADAPGWQTQLQDPPLKARIDRLKHDLQTERPPHDYGRVWLLWASTKMPGLLDKLQQQELVEMIWKHQQADGGWSIRTFASPEAWGRGTESKNCAESPSLDGRPATGIRRA
jgi:squalene-hopene/tetraprenyl-beta-curcumene cyclase